MNITKFSILPVNIDKQAIKLLKRDNNTIDYLGIKLTFPISILYKENFPPLLQSIKQDLLKYIKTEIVHIVEFKMLSLPKILYLF